LALFIVGNIAVLTSEDQNLKCGIGISDSNHILSTQKLATTRKHFEERLEKNSASFLQLWKFEDCKLI